MAKFTWARVNHLMKCPECNDRYLGQGALTRHMNKEHGIDKKDVHYGLHGYVYKGKEYKYDTGKEN